jgi:PhnB protein
MTDAIPQGCSGFIPHLVVSNGAEALEFYKQALGAEELARMPAPDGRIMHAELRLGDHLVYLCDDFPEMCGGKSRNPTALGGSPVNIHRYVEDCDAEVTRAAAAGAAITMPPTDMFWGDRYAMVTDPYGHNWSFATRIKDMTNEEIAQAAAQAGY